MTAKLTRMADAVRVLSMDAVHKARSGHQGMPMGMADVATVLWTKFMKYDAARPDWADRDRFVLSAGHGSMLIYALLHLTGSKAVTMKQIENFRQWGSATPGHPEYGHTPGVETTTGPLGQGLATAVGMAMAERGPRRRQSQAGPAGLRRRLTSQGEDVARATDTPCQPSTSKSCSVSAMAGNSGSGIPPRLAAVVAMAARSA